MKYLILISFLLTQICPNCFESKWQTKTAAVECKTAPAVIAEFQAEGYKVKVKFWELKTGEQICDILGMK